ncbi:MAG: class I SAM-dependent rRNA methyltransferase [Gemmatimonadota bacterium]
MRPHSVSLSDLPVAGPRRLALRLHAPAERALRGGHPWLFESGIREQSHEGKPGDLAVAFDRKGRFLAIGLYDPHSPIRMRVLQGGQPERIDAAWFDARIARALGLRSPLERTGTTGFRLIHGENDGLPGLVVDRYEDLLVAKLYSAAWIPHLAQVSASLARRSPFRHFLVRLSRRLQSHPDALFGVDDGTLLVPDTDAETVDPPDFPVQFRENGLLFEVDPVRGQKTGFFLDQRENRLRVERLAKEAGSVLNVFAYTGGFSLYAARGGAEHVVSLDQSRPALDAALRNFALNRGGGPVDRCRHEIQCGDAFTLLGRIRDEGRRFDMVVVDPPSFAKEEGDITAALGSYTRLARLGLGVLRPGGILVSASCSSRVDAESFFGAVQRGAEMEGRPLREIERTGHPLDHPVIPQFPEGAYLKCLFARS